MSFVRRLSTAGWWQRSTGLIAILALAVFSLPSLGATAAEPTATVDGGTISWGVKKSFRDYLIGPIAHGSVTVADGATDNGKVTTFKDANGSWNDASADAATFGSVRFSGHNNELDVTIANPRLVVKSSGAELLVDLRDSSGASKTGVVFANVDLAGKVTKTSTTVKVNAASATLTKAGEAAFVYDGHPMYTAGTQLDPISATFDIEPAPTPEPTTEPTADTGTAVESGTITWGLKESFAKYVKGPIAKGTVTASSGATIVGNQTVFSGANGTWSANAIDAKAVGTVRFAGHHGELDLRIGSPRLVLDSAGTRLVVDAVTSDGVTRAGLAVATVDLTNRISITGNQAKVTKAPATLTKAGEKLFDYSGAAMYPAGTELDPVDALLEVQSPVVPVVPKPSEPTSAPTTPAPTQPTTSPTVKPTVKPTARPNTRPSAKAGELVWGVKTSFRSYITGPIARGSISVSAGATAVNGGYRFGQGATTAKAPSPIGTTDYRGGVQFSGHHGELNLAMSAPAVRVTSANSATLTAHVAGRGRVDVAVLNLAAAKRTTATGWVQYASAPTALTPAGSGLFARDGSTFYPAGTPMDPVTFSIGSTASASTGGASTGSSTVAAAATASNWTPPAAPPATTGLTIKQDEVNAGEKITASGTGFAPNETGIRVVLYSTPTVLTQDLTADASGKATWTGKIPATVEPGEHTLTFQGSVNRGVVFEIGAAEEIVGCELSDGSLDWGFKESFRAYVSGSIANGDWTTAGNASYETPQFRWVKGEGARAEDTGAGRLEFTGEVNFSGHSGALDTSIANPIVTFEDEHTAVISLDYAGSTMDAAMAGKDDRSEQADIPFADLDLAAGNRTTDGQTVTIADIPATLTAAGNAAFPNYEAGAALDPVTLTFTVATECHTAAAPKPTEEQILTTPTTSSKATDSSLLPWLGGALIGAVLAALATALIMRRRNPGAPA